MTAFVTLMLSEEQHCQSVKECILITDTTHRGPVNPTRTREILLFWYVNYLYTSVASLTVDDAMY